MPANSPSSLSLGMSVTPNRFGSTSLTSVADCTQCSMPAKNLPAIPLMKFCVGTAGMVNRCANSASGDTGSLNVVLLPSLPTTLPLLSAVISTTAARELASSLINSAAGMHP